VALGKILVGVASERGGDGDGFLFLDLIFDCVIVWGRFVRIEASSASGF
jgi:hypothetical protein